MSVCVCVCVSVCVWVCACVRAFPSLLFLMSVHPYTESFFLSSFVFSTTAQQALEVLGEKLSKTHVLCVLTAAGDLKSVIGRTDTVYQDVTPARRLVACRVKNAVLPGGAAAEDRAAQQQPLLTAVVLARIKSTVPLASCSQCNKASQDIEGTLKRCGRCKQTCYCSNACQQSHWALHKRSCRPLEPVPLGAPIAVQLLLAETGSVAGSSNGSGGRDNETDNSNSAGAVSGDELRDALIAVAKQSLVRVLEVSREDVPAADSAAVKAVTPEIVKKARCQARVLTSGSSSGLDVSKAVSRGMDTSGAWRVVVDFSAARQAPPAVQLEGLLGRARRWCDGDNKDDTDNHANDGSEGAVAAPLAFFDDVTLEDCLRQFSKKEYLGEADHWHCSACKQPRSATKELTLHRVPKTLVIQLKRFKKPESQSMTLHDQARLKLENRVVIPLTLDMDEFARTFGNDAVDPDLLRKQGGGGSSGHHVYELFGVVNHYGFLIAGHYTASVRHAASGKWYSFNDERVFELDKPEDAISPDAASILFYVLKQQQQQQQEQQQEQQQS